MSHIPTSHQHFVDRLEDFHKRREWLDNALATVFEYEMAQLAKRFPTRRLELHSGMGTTTIHIDRRPSERGHAYQVYGPDDAHGFRLLDFMEEIAPDLWAAINTYQDEVSYGRDPGLGSIIYENGKRISGLSAGGA